MKDYERLTEKSIGCFKYILKDHKPKAGEFNDYDAFFDYSMAVKRLGELEDKIERGEIDYVVGKDKEIARLTAENAELRERLSRAVELPCKVGDKLYEIIEGEVQGERVENYRIDNMGIWVTVQLKFGTSTILLNEARKIFLTREAAEARLKELKGGKE